MNCFDKAVQFWQNLQLHLLQRGLNQVFEIVERQSKLGTRYTFHTSETLVPKWWTLSMIFFPENGTFFFPELPSAFRSSEFQSKFLLSRWLGKFQTKQSVPCNNNLLSQSNQRLNFGFLLFKFPTRFPSKRNLSSYLLPSSTQSTDLTSG